MKKRGNRRLIISLAVVALIYVAGFIVEQTCGSKSMAVTVLQKGAVYALIAVSMNLLNGFTGLFSLGQAGFMLIGAYSYAILTIPMAKRAAVYQYYDGGIVQFTIGMIPALLVAGIVAALFAALIGMPVLRLKGDYLAIATLGFAEIIRAFIQWDAIGPLTNGSNLLKTYPTLKTVMPGNTLLFTFIVVGICIGLILLLLSGGGDGDQPVPSQADGVCDQLLLCGDRRGAAGHVSGNAAGQRLQERHDVRDPADRGDRRAGLRIRQHYRVLPVHCVQRMVAAVPGHGIDDRRFQGSAAGGGIPDGGVLGGDHGRGAVLPEGNHG